MEEEPSDPDVIDTGWRSTPAARGTLLAVVVLVAVGLGGFLLGGATAGPDVTVDGQVSYACALAESIRESHPSQDDWGRLDEDRAYSEMSAISGLLGLSAPQSGGNDFAEAGWDNLRDPQGDRRGDPLGQILDATLEECGER